MAERIVGFHLSSDNSCVVSHHPQAKTKFAKEQGYVVIRFESGVSLDFRATVVALLNDAKIGARHVWHGDMPRGGF